MAKKKKSSRFRGMSIPSIASMAQLAVVGNWVLLSGTYDPPTGIALHEFMTGHPDNGIKCIVQKLRTMITTGDGWTQVILPVVGIALLKRFVGRKLNVKMGPIRLF